jgi:hypothetical protein
MIAEKAVEQLKTDIANGYDHILMARVSNTKRANEIFNYYKKYQEFNPVQIHTGIKSVKEREKIRKKILSKEAKIVVCVDMLGEGFDLPELKIAVFHDIRKSLPITLQIVGRFTRVKSGILGNATFIANIANTEVRDELKELYSQDADWNALLPMISEDIDVEFESLMNFVSGFKNIPDQLPLQNIETALSCVAYKTHTNNWTPENFTEGIDRFDSYEKTIHDINSQRNTLVVILGKNAPVKWGNIKGINELTWELYILYWSKQQNLLFIHNSNNNGFFKKLAQAVAGGNVEKIQGGPVFRVLWDINRLKFNNVGLKESLGKLINYTMRAGSDIGEALKDAQRENTVKSLLIGTGYEGGSKITMGCSFKGRIWSQRKNNIDTFVKFCNHIGKKVLDETIDPNKILEGTLLPERIFVRPKKMPIGIEWPEDFYKETETRYTFSIEDKKIYLFEMDIVLISPSEEGELKFALKNENFQIEFKLELFKRRGIEDFRFLKLDQKKVSISYGRAEQKLEEYFDENPPTIWFFDGSSLEGNEYTVLTKTAAPYQKSKIVAWNWEGINIRKESQGLKKDADSIQYRVIEKL